MARGRLIGAVVAFALLLLAAPSEAAVTTPVTVAASGQNPNVTLDAAGTAHLAWTGRGVDSKQLFYCRLPAGAGGCSPTQIAAPGDSLTIPIAFNDGTAIRVLSYRYGLTGGPFSQVYMFTSTDGGASFDAGVSTGANVAPYDTVIGPGNAVSFMDSASSCGSCFQRIPLDGSPVTGPASLSSDHPYLGVIGFVDANTPLVVMATGGGDGQFRRWSGAGDINDPSTWLPPVAIGTLDWMRLASGPSGLFLVAQESLSDPDMQVRRFDGTTFGPRTTITSGTRADAAVQDGLGRLHVVGGKFTAGSTGAALFYGSSDNGTTWARDEVVFPGVPATMRMAMLGGDHFGVVVGTYATGQTNAIWAARVGPSAAVPTTGKFVDARVVSGTVLIQVPGARGFTTLRSGDVIPVGSIVDATKGRVRVTIALPNGRLQSTDFYEGVFKVTQAKSGLATMVLRGGNFRSCGRAAAVHAAKSKKVVRKLWGSGSGKFATKGRFAAATIRGTTWTMQDRCDGTLTIVKQGSVVVRDLKKKRSVVVKAGRSYLARG